MHQPDRAVETDLRYPIGRFRTPGDTSHEKRAEWIHQIELLPDQLKDAVEGLSDGQLDTPYRQKGWTVRQVVHHVPDSHMNAYVRFRLALTEDAPRIRTYEEARWAELDDARNGDVELSLALTRALHARWVRLLRSMDQGAWTRAYDHPESGTHPLTRALAMYAWHGRHHVAHITRLRDREGW